MKRYIPPVTRRVLALLVVLVAALATNAWHKNSYSALVASIAAIALAVWLGLQIGNSE